MDARKQRIEKLREQLPFLNNYQKESPNEELKKHSRYIMNLFEKADKEGKDLNIPDQKIDLLIASVEKLKEYTSIVKPKVNELPADRVKKIHDLRTSSSKNPQEHEANSKALQNVSKNLPAASISTTVVSKSSPAPSKSSEEVPKSSPAPSRSSPEPSKSSLEVSKSSSVPLKVYAPKKLSAVSKTPQVTPKSSPVPTRKSSVTSTDSPAPTRKSSIVPTDSPTPSKSSPIPTRKSSVTSTDSPAPTRKSSIVSTDSPAPSKSSPIPKPRFCGMRLSPLATKSSQFLKRKSSVLSTDSPVPSQLSTPVQNISSEPETSPADKSEREIRRQAKELRRLQENIVKDGPLPSRRAIKKNVRYLETNDSSEVPAEEEENVSVKNRSLSPAIKQKETPELKVTERRSLPPLKSIKLAAVVPAVPETSEFTTSTPKSVRPLLSRPTTSFERVLPMKRRSETNLKDERTVPPLKISMLAKKAAEKSIEIKRVMPVKRISSPIKSEGEKKAKIVPEKLDEDEEITFKFKSIVVKPKDVDADKKDDTPDKETVPKKIIIPELARPIVNKPKIASEAPQIKVLVGKMTKVEKPKEPENLEKLKEVVNEPKKIDKPEVAAKDNLKEVIEAKEPEVPGKKEDPIINRKDIENMGFVAVRSGFIFQCLAEKCHYSTLKRFAFIKHLDECHEELKWTGHCKLCEVPVAADDLSCEGEFFHMTEHVQKEKNNPENLPDITELPKEEKVVPPLDRPKEPVKPLMKIIEYSESSNDSIRTLSTSGSSSKPVSPLPTEPDSSTHRISVKSFANISKFTPQEDSENSFRVVAIESSQPKLSVVTDKLSLLRNIQVPKKDFNVDASKSASNNLRALMQKQTEENLKKLQIANKNVSISQVHSTSPSNSVKIIMHAPKPATPPMPEPPKFIIRKPIIIRQDGIEKKFISYIKQDINDINLKETVSLRPWLARPIKKYVNRTIKLLSPSALCATFKCMGAKCEFFTDSIKQFESHLNIHIKTTPGDVASYIICPYCDYNFPNFSVVNFIEHIIREHAFDNYQCKYCFYRSCAHFNVLEHQKIHHRMHKYGMIELNNGKQRDYKLEVSKIKANCGKFIKPLVCATCKLASNETKKFYVLKHYLNHLKNHERNGEKVKVTCKKCGKLFESADAIFQHVTECFNILALDQCVYCLFGTNSVDKMHEHMCNNHPSKMSLICVREDSDPMREGASHDDYQATSLKFLSKTVDSQYIVKASTLLGQPSQTLGGIQIQNVYSLSSQQN